MKRVLRSVREMIESIYERVLSLRNRISLDGDDTIYEEDYLLLDEVSLDLIEIHDKVLGLIENIGGEDNEKA